MRGTRALLAVAIVSLLAVVPSAQAAGKQLMIGVGRADITPVTGVFKGGWSCTCAEAVGQQERLYARAIVIEEGGQKVALVTEDLFALSAGMINDAATLLPGLGFSEANIIDSATHTHSSQSGYMNFSSYNSILPSNSNPTFSGVTNTATDPVMYSYMTRQLALAIRRADDDLRPGAIGWGQTQLLGITENRSLGAHLADYGVDNEGPNGGSTSQDPGGYADTIDPTVNVLRLDQYRKVGRSEREVPIGVYSTFANHGTVDHENFRYYSGDHQGAAERAVESAIRSAGHVPGSQDVINAFANSDAGDMTSGIQFNGPAAAEYVGRREAAAMLAAWRQAGHAMTRRRRSRCASRGSACAGSRPARELSTRPRGSARRPAPAQKRGARSSTTTGWRTRATSCPSTPGPRGTRSRYSTKRATSLRRCRSPSCGSATG